jgi:hypothetical protein
MIVNRQRIDDLIAARGAERTMNGEQWQDFIKLAVNELGEDACYAFSLYPHSAPPQKGVFAGFPGRITADLEYLHTLDLVVVDDDSRERLTDFLDRHGCPWEVISQYDPDTGSDEPIGIRLFGFRDPGQELHNKPQHPTA